MDQDRQSRQPQPHRGANPSEYTIGAAATLLGIHPNAMSQNLGIVELGAPLFQGISNHQPQTNGTVHKRKASRNSAPPNEPSTEKTGTSDPDIEQGSTLAAAERAREIAAYTEGLLSPWRKQIEELARENGRLEAQNENLKQRISDLETSPNKDTTLLTSAASRMGSDPKEGDHHTEGKLQRRWYQRLWPWTEI